METAKLFQNGRSQAVRLPKEYRFEGTEVAIRKVGDMICLFPVDKEWDLFMEGVNAFDEGFRMERLNDPPERSVKL